MPILAPRPNAETVYAGGPWSVVFGTEWRLRHESDDWFQITPKREGETYTGGFHYQIRPYGADVDEDEWLPPTVNGDGDRGADIQGLPRGTYEIFTRIDDQMPYAPVLGPHPLLLT